MTCEVIQAERIAERYAQGGLTAEERTAFEEHFAACTDCFEQLRALEARLGLSARGVPGRKKRRKGHRARKYGWVVVLAVVLAAAAVLAVVLEQYRPPSSEPPPSPAAAQSPAVPPRSPAPDRRVIAYLAAVEPPVFIESMRHGPDNAAYKAFRAAMEPYDVKDYQKAAEALRAAAQLDHKSPAPRFYLAICELALEKTDDAISDLRAVIDLGNTPYLEDAHFFLAKALLATQDLREAREELFRTIRIAGDRLDEARHVLDRLEAQMPGK